MLAIGQLLYWALQFFLIALLVRVVFDYLRMFSPNWRPKGIMLALVELIYAITDPPLNFARRFIPPIRMGAISFDLAYIAVFLVASLLIPFVRLL